MTVERESTGITDLDKMLNGGFMPGDAVLVAGSPGTGKTTLALQYLVNGATQWNEGGVYITFEQLPDQIYRDAGNFGWDLQKLEVAGKLRVVCTSPNILLEQGGESVLEEPIKEIHARRIVIDSLSHLEMYVPAESLRKELYRLLMYLKTKGLSSLSLWEVPQMIGQSFSVTDVGISFLVDCIVLLKFVEIDSTMKKALAVIKMRGSDHDKRLREFEITSQGIKVASPFSEYEGIITGSPRRRAGIDEAVERFSQAFAGKKKK